MYNWRFLVITLLAAVQPIACFSERALVDGRECCERDAAEVFSKIRHSYDYRKTGDRQVPSFRRDARETYRHELKSRRFSDPRTSLDRVRDAAISRERYSTYSDSQRRLLRTYSERIRDIRNSDGRSERFRERTLSLSERRFEPTRVTPVGNVRSEYERRDGRREGVLRQTRSIRITFERESRNNERTDREIRDDVSRSDATRRERRSDTALERREVTRQAREVSLTRANVNERLIRLSRERVAGEKAIANDRESTRTSIRDVSSTRDSRRSNSLPNRRVQLVRRDLSRSSNDELRERDDFRRIGRQTFMIDNRERSRSIERAVEHRERQTNIRQTFMIDNRERSRSIERAVEHRERQTNIRLLAREGIERSRITREQSTRLARSRLEGREESRVDRSRLRSNPLIAEREFARNIRRGSSRNVRLDGNLENRNARFTDRTDKPRVRSTSLTRIDVLERDRINSRSRSHPELNVIETRGTQRISTTNRSKLAPSEDSQFLAENWKALVFYTLQGLYVCTILFRVFSNTNSEKKKARLPNWWPMTRRAIKQD